MTCNNNTIHNQAENGRGKSETNCKAEDSKHNTVNNTCI